jgi:probable F420-dependent oxidoreductase
MQTGVTLRNMGFQATRETMRDCAQHAEDLGFESIWITDHIAIPPDDAQGSEGWYTDTLTTLAWLAGVTTRVKLGAGVLILPYRPALPTAKQIATVQMFADGRLLLGVGVGWMEAEFRALGIARRDRGRMTDDRLEFFRRCFAADTVSANGQEFLFKPRPARPPFLIGGSGPHALRRAVRLGDGWMPMSRSPDDLQPALQDYRRLADEHGHTAHVTVMSALPLRDHGRARVLWERYAALGVDRLVCAVRYDDGLQYRAELEQLRSVIA